MSIDPRGRPAFASLLAALGILSLSCAAPPPEEPAAKSGSWSVTAWGKIYEVFPEIDPLVAGESATAHVHVTQLEGFEPVGEGRVEVLLTEPSGEETFSSGIATKPGVFAIEIKPEAPGERDLAFRITTPEGSEEIRGGRVLVGSSQQAGGLLVAPAPKGASDGGEPLSLLKEAQWRGGLGTAWVRKGQLARSISGLARLRPPAGGEALVTASVDGRLHPTAGADSWPFTGRRVDRGTPLFRLVPRTAADRSLPTLGAEVAAQETELETARARLSRLQELLELEATSRREVEEAAALVAGLEARHAAASRDLATARSSRQGGTAAGFSLRAPFSGEIAEVAASPGATVSAGETLARLVRTDLLWLEVALPPQAAHQLIGESVTGVVLTDSERPPLHLGQGVRLVSIAPELSPRTGTVTALLEAPSSPGLTLGTTMAAQILLDQLREGIVIPKSALIDDGGVAIVYLQLSGESFIRQEVDVLERQGDRLLVEGLQPGQRLVTQGGEAIRRSSLMGSGEAHGHVH